MNNLLSAKHTTAVIEILIEQLGVQESQLTLDARLREDLGSDSLEDVEIIMALEERFNIVIPDGVSERISTVGDIFKALAEILQTPAGRSS